MTGLMERQYQAALGGWVTGLTPDLTQAWAGESPYNIVGYQHPELDALFRQATAQPTHEAAAPYWRRAAAHLAEAQPYTWLYFFDSVNGVSDRVRGARVNSYGPYQNTWEWWVPADRRRAGAAAAGAGADTAGD